MEWRLIPGFIGYRVSDTGIVQSRWKPSGGSQSQLLESWWTMKQSVSPKGYLRVNLRKFQGKKQRIGVHTLMLMAFRQPRPPGHLSRHLDGDRKHNHLTNLAWGTPQENSDDCLAHRTRCMGDLHHAAKLNSSDVDAIRASTDTVKELSARYGVSSSQIYNIRTGRRWNNGGEVPITNHPHPNKLTDDQCEFIRQSPETTVALAKQFGVSQPYVSHIKTGRVRRRKTTKEE